MLIARLTPPPMDVVKTKPSIIQLPIQLLWVQCKPKNYPEQGFVHRDALFVCVFFQSSMSRRREFQERLKLSCMNADAGQSLNVSVEADLAKVGPSEKNSNAWDEEGEPGSGALGHPSVGSRSGLLGGRQLLEGMGLHGSGGGTESRDLSAGGRTDESSAGEGGHFELKSLFKKKGVGFLVESFGEERLSTTSSRLVLESSVRR